MMVRVYEVLFDTGPRVVVTEDGERSVSRRLDTEGLEQSCFFKVGETPRKMRLISETIVDRCTIEGMYASVNNDGLQMICLHPGVIAMRFGSTEMYIDTEIDALPELPTDPPRAA